MKPRLQIQIEVIPTADYERLRSEALDELADALAERFIELAREEIAAELGAAPERLNREQERELIGVLAHLEGGR